MKWFIDWYSLLPGQVPGFQASPRNQNFPLSTIPFRSVFWFSGFWSESDWTRMRTSQSARDELEAIFSQFGEGPESVKSCIFGGSAAFDLLLPLCFSSFPPFPFFPFFPSPPPFSPPLPPLFFPLPTLSESEFPEQISLLEAALLFCAPSWFFVVLFLRASGDDNDDGSNKRTAPD